MKKFLLDVLKARVSPEGWSWLEKAVEATAAPVDSNRLAGFYSGASRRVGKRELALGTGEVERAAALGGEVRLDHWGVDEAARLVLLLSLDHLKPDPFFDTAMAVYDLGDSREQESWLRGLPLLPDCGRFLETAIDACRTNIVPLFESIACENPYPKDYFPEPNFNQVILKALFSGVALNRVVGLEGRLNEELARMADDYVSEREAAGRLVPTDIWLALAPRVGSAGLPRVHRYLAHENPDHRYWAAVGLGLGTELEQRAESRAALQGQHEIEQVGRVRGAIQASLTKFGEIQA